jgi:hypothetical protein
MPKIKKNKDDEKNNVLRHCEVKKQVEVVEELKKEIDEDIRHLTTEEKENMKTQIPLLEEHERIQLFHFIRMDKIKYTKMQTGILLNLKNTNDDFVFKIFKYINKCIDNKKYRLN